MRIRPLLESARRASRQLRTLGAERRDHALDSIADTIAARRDQIVLANADDVSSASDLSASLRDRLKLDGARFDEMVRAVREVRAQPDPLGGTRELGAGRSGIRVTKQRIPLGVVAIVYEARPNVTAECAALTIKSGNAVVLRGGKEASRTNAAIAEALRDGLERVEISPDAVAFVSDTSRDVVAELLGAAGLIDLVIPRGGAGLMAMVDQYARVPVIRHGQGICHVYVDRAADPDKASDIALNAKVQRPGVCNAMETLLVHTSQLASTWPRMASRLAAAGVELRCDPASRAALESGTPVKAATGADWDTEFLDLVLAVRTVGDLEGALDHIHEHGTNHTAAIVTEDEAAARRFLHEVDASCVLWNASTRFNDGGELGLGAEMGISTSKMHAYGPMSATELTAEKIVVYGNGQIRT